MEIFVSLSLSVKSKRSGKRKTPTWWTKLSRKEQHEYLKEHRLSKKKVLNLKDSQGSKSNMVPSLNKVVKPNNKDGKTKKEKPIRYTSEELLKKAGIDTSDGLAKFSPGQHKPKKKSNTSKYDYKIKPDSAEQQNRTAQQLRDNTVVDSTQLPVVHPEHSDWEGFRHRGYSVLNKVADNHKKNISKAPRVQMHRTYSGFTDLMQGKQPSPVKRQAVEDHVSTTMKTLRDNFPDNKKFQSFAKYDKGIASMYMASVKKRYASKPLPFSDTTHSALSRYRPVKASNKPDNVGNTLKSMSSFMSPTKSDHDEYAHVSKFMASDLVEWLSSQSHKDMEFRLKTHRNDHLSLKDAQDHLSI